MLFHRVITALLLAPLLVWSIFTMPSIYFAWMWLFVVAVSAWEFTNFIKLVNKIQRIAFVGLVVVVCITTDYFDGFGIFILYLSIIWWFFNLYQLKIYPQKVNFLYGSIFFSVVNGVLLLVPMWLAIVKLHQQYEPQWLLLLMLLIWGADSGAYFAGRAFGKNKLAVNISPAKTIEGVIGGIVATAIIASLFLQYQDINQKDYLLYFIVVLLVVIMSIAGDLYESLLKRNVNIKDSGQILPGHGGILDRIDSLSSAAPFFLLGINLI